MGENREWLGKVSISTAYEPQTALASAEAEVAHLAVLLVLACYAPLRHYSYSGGAMPPRRPESGYERDSRQEALDEG